MFRCVFVKVNENDKTQGQHATHDYNVIIWRNNYNVWTVFVIFNYLLFTQKTWFQIIKRCVINKKHWLF